MQEGTVRIGCWQKGPRPAHQEMSVGDWGVKRMQAVASQTEARRRRGGGEGEGDTQCASVAGA